MLQNFILFFFSLLIISFAVAVVACKNPIYSVFCLIMVFTATSFLLFYIGVEFLAFILLIVYAGAISILFLFVVLLLNVKVSPLNTYFMTSELYLISALFFKASIVLLTPTYLFENLLTAFGTIHTYDLVINLFDTHYSTIADLYIYSSTFYTIYFIFPIIAGLILLIAMVGALTLTKK